MCVVYCVTPRGLTRAIVTEISWLHISLPPTARGCRARQARAADTRAGFSRALGPRGAEPALFAVSLYLQQISRPLQKSRL